VIDIGSTEFIFSVPSLPRTEFEEYSGRLFDLWERYVDGEFSLPDYSLALELEEGSIKGWGKVGATAAALYIGVCNYGSFIQAIQTISHQVTFVGEYLAGEAQRSLGSNTPKPTLRRRTGALGQLQRLFVKVRTRELTVDEAMNEAEKLIGDDAAAAPEFMLRLNQSLRDAPLFPHQSILPLDGLENGPIPKEGGAIPNSTVPRQRHAILPVKQLRVEIWRRSKRGRRKVKIIEL
jgi:hypothetical protein